MAWEADAGVRLFKGSPPANKKSGGTAENYCKSPSAGALFLADSQEKNVDAEMILREEKKPTPDN